VESARALPADAPRATNSTGNLVLLPGCAIELETPQAPRSRMRIRIQTRLYLNERSGVDILLFPVKLER